MYVDLTLEQMATFVRNLATYETNYNSLAQVRALTVHLSLLAYELDRAIEKPAPAEA